MQLVLYYSNNVVAEVVVNNASGCRLYYGDGDMLNHLECLPVSLLQTVSSFYRLIYDDISAPLFHHLILFIVIIKAHVDVL